AAGITYCAALSGLVGAGRGEFLGRELSSCDDCSAPCGCGLSLAAGGVLEACSGGTLSFAGATATVRVLVDVRPGMPVMTDAVEWVPATLVLSCRVSVSAPSTKKWIPKFRSAFGPVM